ncbi:MAG: class I SAM-dependent methyltransferase [Myxococcales bacterium]|nr:class I SAM-dependent methyltransferase [Myxococcales bacterium]
MGLYDHHLLPHLMDFACNAKPNRYQRNKVVPNATGTVLEVGFGSGLNLPYYDADKVTRLFALEPSEGMRRKAAPRLAGVPFPIEFLDLPGEEIPLDDRSVDAVVITYTLCTVPNALEAIRQVRRVLKPGGLVHFCEHGAAPDNAVRRTQSRLNPLWKLIGGGCHLDRDIPALLEQGGLKIEHLETMYLPSTPRFTGFNYWGAASPRA